MSYFEDVYKRIQQATNLRTQMEISNVLDIRQSSISDAKRRNSIPAEWCMKLFDKYGLNPDWLLKGTEPMMLRTEYGYAPLTPSHARVMEESAAYNAEPLCPATVYTAGNSTAEKSDFVAVDTVFLPPSFSENGVQTFLVEASNMAPIVLKGAFLGINTKDKKYLAGELYGVTLPYEGFAIRRIFFDAEQGKFVLRTENPDVAEIRYTMEELEQRLMGRLVWVMQKM